MNRTGLDALWAGLFAAVITFAVTPLSARLATRLGAVDQPRGRGQGATPVVAATTGGADVGFVGQNFPPASSFVGDCGSNLLGYLLGVGWVQGSLKTNALVAVVIPLIVLAVPFLDTTFVVLKR